MEITFSLLLRADVNTCGYRSPKQAAYRSNAHDAKVTCYLSNTLRSQGNALR